MGTPATWPVSLPQGQCFCAEPSFDRNSNKDLVEHHRHHLAWDLCAVLGSFVGCLLQQVSRLHLELLSWPWGRLLPYCLWHRHSSSLLWLLVGSARRRLISPFACYWKFPSDTWSLASGKDTMITIELVMHRARTGPRHVSCSLLILHLVAGPSRGAFDLE